MEDCELDDGVSTSFDSWWHSVMILQSGLYTSLWIFVKTQLLRKNLVTRLLAFRRYFLLPFLVSLDQQLVPYLTAPTLFPLLCVQYTALFPRAGPLPFCSFRFYSCSLLPVDLVHILSFYLHVCTKYTSFNVSAILLTTVFILSLAANHYRTLQLSYLSTQLFQLRYRHIDSW